MKPQVASPFNLNVSSPYAVKNPIPGQSWIVRKAIENITRKRGPTQAEAQAEKAARKAAGK